MKKLLVCLSLLCFGFAYAQQSKGNSSVEAKYELSKNGICMRVATGQMVPIKYCQEAASHSYQLNNYGQCLHQASGQVVPYNYCKQTLSKDYQLNSHGQCLQTTTGQIVPNKYCQ